MTTGIKYSEDFFISLNTLTGIPLKKIKDYAKENNPFNILEHPMVVEPNEKQLEKISKLNQFIRSYGVLRMMVEQMRVKFSTPEDSGQFFSSILGGMKDKERFMVAFLDNSNSVIECRTVSEGTVNMAMVYPRDILKIAIANDCSSMILAHNHPGGSRKPSEEDILLTQRIVDIFTPLRIRVLDHVVVGGGRYSSMAELGYLPISPLNKANYEPISLNDGEKLWTEQDKCCESTATEEEEELEL